MAGAVQQQETFAQIPDGTVQVDQETPPIVATPEIDLDDADALELIEARREAEAEQAGTEGQSEPGKQPDKDAGQKQAAPAVKPEGANAEKPAPVMIPKERLDEVLRRASELERTAAYLQGQLEATRSLAQPQGQPAPQQRQPTPEEALAQVHSHQDELATKFDNGEISFAELQKQQRTLVNQEQQLREQQLMARIQPQQTQPAAAQGDGMYLKTLTKQLEDQHPYLHEMTDAQINWLAELVKQEMSEQGFQFRNDDDSRYQLRKQVAQRSDQLGPGLTGKQLQLSGQGQPPAPGPSATAAARAAKLNMQGGMPPDLTSIPNQGGGAGTPGELSDTEIENMSDEEILAAMPASVRNKMLGITE